VPSQEHNGKLSNPYTDPELHKNVTDGQTDR